MSYFKHHVFFCCNQRENSESCCNNLGATDAQTYAKNRIAELKLKGKGKVRINKAGCMDRCDEGHVLVIYPEAVWYQYVDTDDIEDTCRFIQKVNDTVKITNDRGENVLIYYDDFDYLRKVYEDGLAGK